MNCLQQFNPQPPQHLPPSIQPNLKKEVEPVSFREVQVQQVKEIGELTHWINENMSGGNLEGTMERDMYKKRRNVEKKGVQVCIEHGDWYTWWGSGRDLDAADGE